MVNDRGSIKWTSLMLPEHVEMLQRLWREDKNKQKPLLDEQELEQINEMIHEAYQRHLAISITVYKNNNYKEYKGIISSVVMHNHCLKLKQADDDIVSIYLPEIIDVKEA
ncbi:YolD-like family protein [Aquibacillus koreensis]|uniref:YolD-like family protein n=1 Tax=Aquibacillus koreensis TaxID=279446 RepID=A0A9X4ALU0_9BACI|nr:YolD-like family protein [Aquibacillus koreensis]MCT2535050.1 YolD-like family protein [Aquibacillus koreensis]MDC3422828.1 YolD-like family protein [Aquibacillus koreensis]